MRAGEHEAALDLILEARKVRTAECIFIKLDLLDCSSVPAHTGKIKGRGSGGVSTLHRSCIVQGPHYGLYR